MFKVAVILRIDLVRSENICGKLQSPSPYLVRPLLLWECVCVCVWLLEDLSRTQMKTTDPVK